MSVGFLGEWLRRAARSPEDIAFTLYSPPADIHLTNGMLLAGATRWARFLSDKGAQPGDIVLIALPLGAELIQSFLGALLAGCITSFMPYPSIKQDPTFFWSTHDELFARIGGGIIVASAKNADAISLKITRARMIAVTPDGAARVPTRTTFAPFAWRPDQTACLQHSSGTTGLKKGVMLSFEKIERQIAAYRSILGFSPTSTFVSWLPLYHDMGFVTCLLTPLAVGNRAVLLDPFDWVSDPLSLLEAVETYRGEFAWLPNFAFHHIANAASDDDRRVDLSSLKAVIDCSEPCLERSLSLFEERFSSWGLRPHVTATCYAMAEAVFALTQSRLGKKVPSVRARKDALEEGRVVFADGNDDETKVLLSSGTALPGVEILLLNKALKPVVGDLVGQIALRAPFLFDGYHQQPERTAAAFHDGYYLTGDFGFLAQGELFVLGRFDDILILSGRSIFAREIEDTVGEVAGVRPGRVFAFGHANADRGTQELIVVAETNVSDLSQPALRKTIRTRLQAGLGLTPSKTLFVREGWIVKSTSGKINRNENRLKFERVVGNSPSPANSNRI